MIAKAAFIFHGTLPFGEGTLDFENTGTLCPLECLGLISGRTSLLAMKTWASLHFFKAYIHYLENGISSQNLPYKAVLSTKQDNPCKSTQHSVL